MKKLIAAVLSVVLLANQGSVISAEETSNEDKGSNLTLKINSTEQSERVYLSLPDEEKVNIDSKKSKMILTKGPEELEVMDLINDNDECYFQLPREVKISDNTWKIKEIIIEDISGTKKEIDFDLENIQITNIDSVVNAEDMEAISEETNISSYADDANEKIEAFENVEDIPMLRTFAIRNRTNVQQGLGNYTISASIDGSISKVLFATWTSANGQDDLVWSEGEISNGQVSFTVNMRDHKNESGTYITHVYFYDKNGTPTVEQITVNMDSIKPTIQNIRIKQEDGFYTVTGIISGNVNKVLFPTWTNKNGQDDIIWHSGTINGNQVSCKISMNDHKNETGNYITHAYAYDESGNTNVYALSQNMTKVSPTVENLRVVNGDGYYTITGTINHKTTKVLFPTWTSKNGQDDIAWKEGVIQGNTVSHTVYMKDHKNETGEYNTHVYAYDNEGNHSVKALKTNVSKVLPEVKNVTVTRGNGQYTVTADITGNVTKVLFPTWTEKNGQDDIAWEEGRIQGSKVTHTIYSRNHNFELGKYITHIYAYDSDNKYTVKPIEYLMPESNIKINNVITTGNQGKFTVTADVSGDVSKVLIPVWTEKNGQDDLIWHEGKISGNKATATIDMKDHKFETGVYNVHVYAYDASGKSIVTATSVNVKDESPIIKDIKISDVSSQGYLVTATVTDDYKLDKVLFPTWTSANGQDDIVWGEGKINGNVVSYRVYVKDHNYAFGEYNTHIYAYDMAGNLTAQSIAPISINESNMSSGWKIVNGHKYLYDASGKLVDGSGLFVVDISEHNGDVDWQAVKNSGVDGVILRSSYGFNFDHGFSESQMDAKFKRNVSELNRLGIPYGVYHFSYAKNLGEGKQEAHYMIECMKAAGAHPTLPVYYDLEQSNFVGSKDNNFYTSITKEFAEVMRNSGYTFGVYANYNWFTTKLIDSSFNNYIKWVAHYGSDANNAAGTANPNWHPSGEYKMWQYSSRGKVNGIKGNVDLNVLLNW